MFDDSGHPNGSQNGSSRDNRPSGRRGAGNGRGVTDMPKPEKFTSQDEYVSVAAPIPTAPRHRRHESRRTLACSAKVFLVPDNSSTSNTFYFLLSKTIMSKLPACCGPALPRWRPGPLPLSTHRLPRGGPSSTWGAAGLLLDMARSATDPICTRIRPPGASPLDLDIEGIREGFGRDPHAGAGMCAMAFRSDATR